MNGMYTLNDMAAMMGLPLPDIGSDVRPTGISIDTRTLKPGDLFFALSGERFDADRFVDEAFAKGAVGAVTHTAHCSGPCLITRDPLKALQELAAAHRARMNATVIGITGSCGKTTAKDMAAAVLSAKYPTVKTQGNLNNDIGCPLSLLGILPTTRYAVIEMGANHVGEIAAMCEMARPSESAVTLVAPAHLEGFGSLERIARAKGEIADALPPDGCFYVNMDNPWCRAMGERYQGEKVRFGSEGDFYARRVSMLASGEMELDIFPVGVLRLPLQVRAHVANVLLAVAIGSRHGVEDLEPPLRRACEQSARFKILRVGPMEVLDDTYNANPASMRAALEALKDRPGSRKIAVLGEMLELGKEAAAHHRALGEHAAAMGVHRLLACGEHGGDIVEGAHSYGLLAAERVANHEQAASLLARDALPGDVILIKGSRGMKMEMVITLLQGLFPDSPCKDPVSSQDEQGSGPCRQP